MNAGLQILMTQQSLVTELCCLYNNANAELLMLTQAVFALGLGVD